VKLLFVVPYAPNLIRVRPYQLIRHLVARGHQVTLLTLWSEPREQGELAVFQGYGLELHAFRLLPGRSMWNCIWALPTRLPLQSVYCWQPAMARQAVELIDGRDGRPAYDAIHVEHLRGARYGIHLKAHLQRSQVRVPIIWDSVDSISHLFNQAAEQSQGSWRRWIARFELHRTQRYEGWLARQFARVLVTSPVDRQAFLSLVPLGESSPAISVLPNGVDLEYFRPASQEQREPTTLVLSGKMSYHANISMATYLVSEIMPLVWAQRPDVRLVIAGKDPPTSLKELASNPAVTVTGALADIRPCLQQAALALAPLTYGAGISNKILEAMACATPVIATTRAISGLKARPGEDLLIADTSVDFAGAVLDLLADPQYRCQIGLAGRRYVETHHRWDDVACQLEEIYQSALDILP